MVKQGKAHLLFALFAVLFCAGLTALFGKVGMWKDSEDMEELVAYRVACVANEEIPIEQLKALSVVLRSELLARPELLEQTKQAQVAADRRLPEQEGLEQAGLEQETEPMTQMRRAVQETRGIYLSYGGKVIAPLWTVLTNGTTRDGEENGMKEKPYLQKVPCKQDILAEDYSSKVICSQKRFIQLFAAELEGQDRNNWGLGWPSLTAERDSAGYVTKVYLGNEKKAMSGGEFADRLGLASPAFQMTYYDKQVVFTVSGLGHGFGMSLWQGKALAKEGKDFMQILHHFYPGTKLEKCY